MQTARYRHRLILERRVDTKQPSGQVAHAYAEFAEVLGSVEPLSGREYFAAAQIQADVSTRLRIHWRDDIDETCRVVHIVKYSLPTRADIYDINAVLPDAKTGRREIQLMCTKRIADGWRRDSQTAVTPPDEDVTADSLLITVDSDQLTADMT